jgi:hypothetical protein
MVAQDILANPTLDWAGPGLTRYAERLGDERRQDLDAHGYVSDYYEGLANTPGLTDSSVEVLADVIRFKAPTGADWYFRRFRPAVARLVGGLHPDHFSAGIGARSVAMKCCSSPFSSAVYFQSSTGSVAVMFGDGPFVVLVTGIDAFESESEYVALLMAEDIDSRIRKALGFRGPMGRTGTSAMNAVSPPVSAVNVKVCRTAFATSYIPVHVLPRVGLDVVSSAANSLSLYVDAANQMGALGPKGWTCKASYSADGSGGLTISDPHGVPLGKKGATEGVTTWEYLCSSCAMSAACPYVKAASQDLARYYPGQVCSSIPAREMVRPVSSAQIDFTDPSSVSGLGSPSGGRLTARGALAYDFPMGATSGTDEATYSCTLPASLRYVCGAGTSYANEDPSGSLPVAGGQAPQQATATPTPVTTPQATPTPVPTPIPGITFNSVGTAIDGSTRMHAYISSPTLVADQSGNNSLPSGWNLLLFYVKIGNHGTQTQSYSEGDFSCLDSANQTHQTDVILPGPYSNAELNYGQIAPGDFRAGWVGCADNPSGEARITWDDDGNVAPTVVYTVRAS